MEVVIVGRGSVGRALGERLERAGHEVLWAVREPDPGDARQATVPDALRGAATVLLAVPWDAVHGVADVVAEAVPPDDGRPRLVVDCTNPLRPGPGGLALEGDPSGGAEVAARLPDAVVFKAFNSVGADVMADPMVEGRRPVMPFCGDGDVRRDDVRRLVQDVGFEAADAGGLDRAHLLESLALLWIGLAGRGDHGRDFAFGLLRRDREKDA